MYTPSLHGNSSEKIFDLTLPKSDGAPIISREELGISPPITPRVVSEKGLLPSM